MKKAFDKRFPKRYYDASSSLDDYSRHEERISPCSKDVAPTIKVLYLNGGRNEQDCKEGDVDPPQRVD